MNGAAFIVISVLTLAAALAAATLPNLMHAAFCFVLALLGLASFFFLLGAEFVGLALVFIYIGAVAVLIVFTILLTRRDSKEHHGFNPPPPKATAWRAWSGVVIALAVFGGLTWAILNTQSLSIVPPHARALTVKRIGETLMTGYVWPLQCVGLLLTAALIGALVLVMEERR
jgi:NADH:ubiquinone oxidoreductase subunit 6 (subunit J)